MLANVLGLFAEYYQMCSLHVILLEHSYNIHKSFIFTALERSETLRGH